ncbi:hypothetical protein ACFFU1_17135 [Algibacter miyuki]|uniref:Anti-sigma factor n=1 Tax=Algibacter miyuki TaxID=1306933 RepID=A0ABV5H411_9FLAO|nr:hypothetical protein [Algibacter miyuki]MDN3665703.1 hypothetical protein [Algibacter miyuki]
MVLNNIEELLEKYENGETSLKEEQQLKHYFASDQVAPHLEMYKPMFGYFTVSKQEQFNNDLPLETSRKFNYKWLSVAAVAVLMIGFYFGGNFNDTDLGTYDDPELALAEVTRSLEMISQSFNKGVSTVAYLDEVEKGTATLGYLNELDNATELIFKN